MSFIKIYNETIHRKDSSRKETDRNQVIEPEEILFDQNEVEISLDDKFYWIGMKVLPEDAMTGVIKWTSSDTDVVTLDTEFAELVGTGDATVTATLGNGVSASLHLHVTEPEQQ